MTYDMTKTFWSHPCTCHVMYICTYMTNGRPQQHLNVMFVPHVHVHVRGHHYALFPLPIAGVSRRPAESKPAQSSGTKMPEATLSKVVVPFLISRANMAASKMYEINASFFAAVVLSYPAAKRAQPAVIKNHAHCRCAKLTGPSKKSSILGPGKGSRPRIGTMPSGTQSRTALIINHLSKTPIISVAGKKRGALGLSVVVKGVRSRRSQDKKRQQCEGFGTPTGYPFFTIEITGT